MGLLESALAVGIVDPDVAGPCMAEILRVQQAKPLTRRPVNEHWTGGSLPRWEATRFD